MALVETSESGGVAGSLREAGLRVGTEAGLRFSVIIPLESHRGQASRCVRGWAEQERFPRERFELVVVSPAGHPRAELDEIRRLLAPQDRLLELDHHHDMALCADAARLAHGELLFFTESHCIPEPGTLATVDVAARRHRDWAGFSIRSVPITRNLLSRIEAELYGRDIEFGATQHPWRKVLDQCFVVHRSAYFEAGGFDPAFGHFAEWLIAARLHVLGLKVGYAPEARIHHLYLGKFSEWRRFTEDFLQGQLKYLALDPGHPLGEMFGEVPEWSRRGELRRVSARRVCLMLLRDLRRPAGIREARGQARLLARWLRRAVTGPSSGLTAARCRRWSTRFALRLALLRRDRPRALDRLERCCEAIAAQERARFVREWSRGRRHPDPSSAEALDSREGSRTPVRLSGVNGAGFHLASGSGLEAIRWSEPVAFVELPLEAGRYLIELSWLFRPAVGGEPRLTFYLDERPVAGEDVRILHDRAELRVSIPHTGSPVRLGWVCSPYRAPGDRRELGLPVTALSWRRAREVGRTPISFARGGDGEALLGRGWSRSEAWGTWSIEDEATLRLAPAESRSPETRLALRYRILEPPEGEALVVECRLGGRTIERWELDAGRSHGELFVDLHEPRPADGFELAFAVFGSRTPAELGLSDDDRRLGIGLEQARLVEVDELRVPPNVAPDRDNGPGGC